MMVSISEYYDNRNGRKHYNAEIVTRNKDTANKLIEKLVGKKYYYGEYVEVKTRYRFRFPHMRKDEIKQLLKKTEFCLMSENG